MVKKKPYIARNVLLPAVKPRMQKEME